MVHCVLNLFVHVCVCVSRCTTRRVSTALSTRSCLTLDSCSVHLIQAFTASTSLCD